MRLFKQLPASWVETTLGDICGFAQYGLNAKAEEGIQDGVFFLRISDIDDKGRVNDSGHKYVSISESDLAKYRLLDGDLVIARSGTVGRSYVYHHTEEPWVFASYLIRFRPEQDIVLSDYLGFYMKSAFYWHYIDMMSHVVALPNINSQELKNLPVPLPPLSEQQELVDMLREVDALHHLQRQAYDRSQSLIPAIFNSMFGDPLLNPKKWPRVQTKEISKKITDGTHQSPKFDEKGEIPFLFVSNIVNGVLDLETDKFISEDTYKDLTRNTPIERNDILYSSVGSYGVAVLVNTDKRFAFQRHIAHIKPDASKINPLFLTVLLNSWYIKAQADRVARGIAQKTVNLAEIRRFDLFLPPLDLQNEFAALVEDVLDISETQLQSARQFDNLTASALSRAFTGELTATFRQRERELLNKEAADRDMELGLKRQQPFTIDLQDDDQHARLTRNIGRLLHPTLTELLENVSDETPIMQQSFPAFMQMVDEVAPALPDGKSYLSDILSTLLQNTQHGLRQRFVASAEIISERILPFFQQQLDTKTVLEILLKHTAIISELEPHAPQATRISRISSSPVSRLDERLQKLLHAIEQRPPYFRAFDLVHDGMGLDEVTSGLRVLYALGFIRRVVWESTLDAVFRLVDPTHPDDIVAVATGES